MNSTPSTLNLVLTIFIRHGYYATNNLEIIFVISIARINIFSTIFKNLRAQIHKLLYAKLPT